MQDRDHTQARFEGTYEDDKTAGGREFTVEIENDTTYKLIYEDEIQYVDSEEFHESSVKGYVMPTDGRTLP